MWSETFEGQCMSNLNVVAFVFVVVIVDDDGLTCSTLKGEACAQ